MDPLKIVMCYDYIEIGQLKKKNTCVSAKPYRP